MEQYAEYEPLPRKGKAKEINDFYEKETDRIVERNPWNTGSNIAREIVSTKNKYDHAEGTAANYVRPILKNNYNVSLEKEWRKPNYEMFMYEALSEEELNYLKEMFNKYMGKKDADLANIIAAQEAGYCTKEEAFDTVKGWYNGAMDAFVEKYGYRPIKVGKYEKNLGES